MWLLILALTLPLILFASFRRVREGEVVRFNRFGRPAGVLTPGVHWLLPGEAIATRVSLLGRHLELAPRRVHGGAHTARVGGRVYYQVLDVERASGSAEVIESRVSDALLTRLSHLLPQLSDLSAPERNQLLRDDLRSCLRDEGILLIRLELAIETRRIG
jgi:regulator of protease activity HflC (stomatin/prohibitin superfamily)